MASKLSASHKLAEQADVLDVNLGKVVDDMTTCFRCLSSTMSDDDADAVTHRAAAGLSFFF